MRKPFDLYYDDDDDGHATQTQIITIILLTLNAAICLAIGHTSTDV